LLRTVSKLTLSLWKYLGTVFLVCVLLTPWASARPLERIRQSGKIKVAISALQPMNRLQGFELDLARKLAVELLGDAQALELLPARSEERLAWVEQERVDMAIAQVSITPERTKIVDFSPPYYQGGQGFVFPKNMPIQRLSDLNDRKVAVLEKSSSALLLAALLPKAIQVPVTSYQQGFEKLLTGSVQVFTADDNVLIEWLATQPNYRLLPQRMGSYSFAIALPKGLASASWRAWIQATLEKLDRSGWLEERRKYWQLSTDLASNYDEAKYKSKGKLP
jgi:polar amino acid transport system substrate-binding protein